MQPTIQRVTFPGAQGHTLTGKLDLPTGRMHALALFAHFFTCSSELTKDGLAVMLANSPSEWPRPLADAADDATHHTGWWRKNRSGAYGQNCLLASAAPCASAVSLANTTFGSTPPDPA